MRPRHIQHSLPNFPIYSAAFIAPNKLVIGGGGGSSKSGIKNKLASHRSNCFPSQNLPVLQRLYSIDSDREIHLNHEIEVDDAPTSMTVDQQVGNSRFLRFQAY